MCRADLSKASLGLKGISGDQPAGKSSSGKATVSDVVLQRVYAARTVYDAAEPLVPGRKVSQVSSSGEVLCGLDAKDDRIVHLRAIQKGACADLTCRRLDDHASSIRRCAFTPSDRLVTCDATGNLRVWHWERRGEVLPSPPNESSMASGRTTRSARIKRSSAGTTWATPPSPRTYRSIGAAP